MICNNPNSFGSGFIGDSAGGGFGSGLSTAPFKGDGYGAGPFAYAISGDGTGHSSNGYVGTGAGAVERIFDTGGDGYSMAVR